MTPPPENLWIRHGCSILSSFLKKSPLAAPFNETWHWSSRRHCDCGSEQATHVSSYWGTYCSDNVWTYAWLIVDSSCWSLVTFFFVTFFSCTDLTFVPINPCHEYTNSDALSFFFKSSFVDLGLLTLIILFYFRVLVDFNSSPCRLMHPSYCPHVFPQSAWHILCWTFFMVPKLDINVFFPTGRRLSEFRLKSLTTRILHILCPEIASRRSVSLIVPLIL